MRHLSESEQRLLSFQSVYWTENSNARTFDHPIVRFFAEQRLRYLMSKFDFSEVECAIEVGAGDGFGTYYTNRLVPKLIATDLSHQMLARSPMEGGLKVRSSAESSPFADGSADLVYCWEVLHHVSSVEIALAEMCRVSRKWVVFFEPNRNHPAQFFFSLLKKSEHGGLKFSQRYLKGVCAAANLDIIHMETVGCIFPNMTPGWLFPLLKRLAFIRPLTGISNVVIARKRTA